jgi:hypothetical protein
MNDKYRVVEWSGGGEPIVTICCAKADWVKLLRDAQHLAAREAELAEVKSRFTAPIVCMCGSTRFKQAWIAENTRLTLAGNIVLAVGMFGHADGQMAALETNGSKIRLDDLHKRKIDLCDWVWVIDVNGYIGVSTRSEIAYAEKLGKPVRYLSQEFPEYVEPVDDRDARILVLMKALQAMKKRLVFLSSDAAKDYSKDNSFWINLAREALSGKESAL